MEDNIFSETAIELLRLFQTRYQFLDIKELECIFENGIYGNYGEVFEISAVAIRQWIEKYLVSPDREKYVKSHQPRIAISAKSTKTDSEKLLEAIVCVARKYLDYTAKGGEMHDYGNHIYNFLDKHNLISFSAEKKNEEMRKAYTVLHSEQQAKCTGFSISAYVQKVTEPKDINARLISIAKNSLLAQYFDKIKAENKQDAFFAALKRISNY